MTDYRDDTPFDASTTHSVEEIAKAIRTKKYGKDTREAMAQSLEKIADIAKQNPKLVSFFPSKDGLINYDSKNNEIDFNCINDQAMFAFSDGSYTLIPKNYKLFLEFPGNYTAINLVLNKITGEISIQDPYKELTGKEFIIGYIRRKVRSGKSSKLIFGGLIKDFMLKNNAKESININYRYQTSAEAKLTFKSGIGLDLGIVEGGRLPVVYVDSEENPVTVPSKTIAVIDTRNEDYINATAYKVTWEIGTDNAVLTPYNAPNIEGYITIFTVYFNASLKNNPTYAKTSIGEPVFFENTVKDITHVRFSPSRNGLPYIDSERNLLNFNCVGDQAFIDYDGKSWQLAQNATLSLDMFTRTGTSVIDILLNLATGEVTADYGYRTNHFTPGKVVFGKIRKTSTETYLVEGFKTLENTEKPVLKGIVPIAHRGLNSLAPEESLEAYSLAVKSGYLDLECDVHFTSDGVPVLHHDDTINRIARTSEGQKIEEVITIKDTTLEILSGYDYGVYKAPFFSGTKIVTFEDFVKFAKQVGAFIHVELVHSYTTEQQDLMLNILKKYNMLSKIGWQSFEWDDLNYIMSKDENAQVELLSNSYSENLLSKGKAFKNGKRKVVLSVGSIEAENVESAHIEGLEVYVWTVDDKSKAMNYIKMGIDGLLTNGWINLPYLLSKTY